MMWLGQT